MKQMFHQLSINRINTPLVWNLGLFQGSLSRNELMLSQVLAVSGIAGNDIRANSVKNEMGVNNALTLLHAEFFYPEWRWDRDTRELLAPLLSRKVVKTHKVVLTAPELLNTLSPTVHPGMSNTVRSNQAKLNTQEFLAVPKIAIKENVKTFENSVFVVWDIETIGHGNINGYTPEVPIMTGWVISNKGKFTKGHSFNYDLNNVDEGAFKMVQDMLENVTAFMDNRIRYAKKINPVKSLQSDLKPKPSKGNVYFYAHNAGKFDLKVMLKAIYKVHKSQRLELPIHISDPNHDIYQITIKYNGYNIIFRDSMKLLLSSVANLNEQMLSGKFPKIPMNLTALDSMVEKGESVMFDINRTNVHTLCSVDSRYGVLPGWEKYLSYESAHEYLVDYCVMDCEIVAAALIKASSAISKALGMSIGIKECITISSMAMYVFTHKFNSIDTPIMSMNLSSAATSFIRKAYIGGRVEVFDSGINLEKVYHFDVPGMYALCMTKDLPYGNPVFVGDFAESIDASSFISELHSKKLIGFFKCSATCPRELNLPVLGIKASNGKLYFPVGNMVGTWSSYELELAISKGYTVTIIEGYVFKVGNPLKNYSESFTAIKNNSEKIGDKATRTIAKLFLNSLYGKFASHYFVNASQVVWDSETLAVYESLYKINSIMDVDTDIKVINHNIMPKDNAKVDQDTLRFAYKKSQKAISDKNTNMAIAATITAHARIVLYNLYIEVEKMGGKVCYSDTDSVFAWLPESPFNKPFGPFIWTGDPMKETANKALFIAPKMYYFSTLNGDCKFKVKGVSTKGSTYTYEELVQILKDKGRITFTNQKSFNNFPLKSGAGIIVKENLSKTYAMLETKRTWVWDEQFLYTKPVNVNITDTPFPTDIPITHSETLLKTIMNTPLKDYKFSITGDVIEVMPGITQVVKSDINAITFTINENILSSNFEVLWSQIISTVKVNTENFDRSDNVTRLQIVAKDSIARQYVYLLHQTGFKWIGSHMSTIKQLVSDLILKAETGYDNVYDFDLVKFTVYFKSCPKIVFQDEKAVIQQLRAELKTVEAMPSPLSIELDINKKREELKMAQIVSKELGESLSFLNKKEQEIITKMLKEMPEVLMKEDIFANLDIDYLIEAAGEDASANYEELVIDIKLSICDIIVKAFWKRMVANGYISMHSWKDFITEYMNIKSSDERGIKLSMKMAWSALIIYKASGMIGSISAGTRVYDKETQKWYFTQLTLKFSPQYNEWNMVANKIHILNKISFTPVYLKYDKDSQDPVLSSKDKCIQINKLNRVKVFLNNQYYWMLIEIYNKYATFKSDDALEVSRVKQEFITLIDWKRDNERKSGIVEIQQVLRNFVTINNLMADIGINYYYNIHIQDDRGRVYPKLTNFSHMASKWMRPLFCLENSFARLRDMPMFNKDNQFTPFERAQYYMRISKTFKVPLTVETTLEDFINSLESLRTEKLNPQLENRIIELTWIKEKGFIDITAPFQYDMKNNALQHIATICNNDEVMKAVGVLPGYENQLDVYQIVAKDVLIQLRSPQNILWANKILIQLPIEEEELLKVMRKIVKKAVIVIAYSARFITMVNYVIEELNDLNINADNRALQRVGIMVVGAADRVLKREVELIEAFKKMIKTEDGSLRWNFGAISDFKVKTQYLLRETKEMKINFKGNRAHTTYKVWRNNPDISKVKLAAFVNVIHSLDALNLILFVNRIDNFNILTIHDALLVNYRENERFVVEGMTRKFVEIHNKGTTFKHIVGNLSNKAGNNVEVLISNWGSPDLEMSKMGTMMISD